MNIPFWELEYGSKTTYGMFLSEKCTYSGPKEFNSPKIAAKFFVEELGLHRCPDEHLFIIPLTLAYNPLGLFECSRGPSSGAACDPCQIFRNALTLGARNIILCHNHTTENIRPSQEDIEATKRIKAAGELLNCNLVDHIIIGAKDGGYYSFKEDDAL